MPDWSPLPPRLSLSAGEAHVVRLCLSVYDEQQSALAALLDETERARAARFIFEPDRKRYQSAHGLVRQALERITGQSAAELLIAYTQEGKPYLPDFPQVQFNISHSRAVGLLAVCMNQWVGVDIEAVRTEIDFHAITQRFFAPQEQEMIHHLPEEERMRAFFTLWTRKEAYIKGRGLGLKIPIDSFAVPLAEGPVRLIAGDPLLPPGEEWTLYPLPEIEGFASALAVEGGRIEIECWEFESQINTDGYG